MTGNLDCNSMCVGQFSQQNRLNNHNMSSCKMEVNHPHSRSTYFTTLHQRSEPESHRVLISNNTYYGHHQVKFSSPVTVEEPILMDCEMQPVSSHCTTQSPLSRKRSADDVSPSRIKRLKQEDGKRSGPKKFIGRMCKEDQLLDEELFEGIHGCFMFHILQEESTL